MVLILFVGFVIVKHYSESDWFVQNTRSYQGSSMLWSQTKNQVGVLSGSGSEIFTKCLQFGVLAVWCGLIICPVARSCDVKKCLITEKSWFSVLKMGLTGIAAWSAQASDRVRSSSPTSGEFCDQRYMFLSYVIGQWPKLFLRYPVV